MFDYEEILDNLANIEKMKGKKRRRFLRELFKDEDFMEWLFKPKAQGSTENLMAQVNDLYAALVQPKVIKSMVDMIEDVGEGKFTRSHATFLYSIANIAIESNAQNVASIADKKKSGELSNKEVSNYHKMIERYNGYISQLIRTSKRIVKRQAKEISNATNIPRFISYTALYSIPEVKYIDKFKIGYYLNNFLNTVYSEVDTYESINTRTLKWKVFFREVFGKENVVEVATFILLEGVHRIEKYKNSDTVKDVWDSLTEFALKELNEAPEILRNQMIELYIKRIDKMFANKSFDLRVDLLSISDSLFPKLSSTVSTYSDRIEDILKRGK